MFYVWTRKLLWKVTIFKNRLLKFVYWIILTINQITVGKDNLPVNRYCHRETPEWQKKITFFYDKNNANESSTSTQNCETSDQNTKDKLKRENSEIDETDEKTENDSVSTPKKSKNSADDESNVDGASAVNESEVNCTNI